MGTANLNVLGDAGKGLEQLINSLEIDPYYDWTYGLLGDYTERFEVKEFQPESTEWRNKLVEAAKYYETALQYADANNSSFKRTMPSRWRGYRSSSAILMMRSQTTSKLC